MSQPAHPPSHPAGPRPPDPGALTIAVRPWSDPLLDRFGHDARSPYVERFWLPILGPSGTLLLRRLAEGFDDRPDGYALDLTEVARALGMGRREGPSASFRRTLDRVISFGFAQFIAGAAPERGAAGEPGTEPPPTLAVRLRLPGLTQRQQQRLPRALRDDHDTWLDGQPTDEVIGARVQHLALSLLHLGEDPPQVEAHLLELDFHPTVVRRAVRWATDRVPGAAPPGDGASAWSNDAA
jgi:hypothetical protein